MSTISIHEAQAKLPEIISGLQPGETLVIVQGKEPLATLTRNALRQWPCHAGSARDTEHWMAADFDAPLEEFQEYVQ